MIGVILSLSIPCFSQNAVHSLPKTDSPPDTEIWEGGVVQDSQGEWKYLKGAAEVRTSEVTITADEIDFNGDTSWAYARGHVRMVHYATGDILNADHAEYNLKTEEGKFFIVYGTAPSKIMTSPGSLTTTNPFYYQGEWADRIKTRLILHKGFITDCKIPKPWWTFQAPVFDIVPGQHAIARRSIFRVKHVPVLYLPYFYRALGKNTRQSGFLTPTFGHSTTHGWLYGGGYYWAINRSYDTDYALQYMSLRGTNHTFDFRGKPDAKSDFNFSFFGVQDNGIQSGQQGYTDCKANPAACVGHNPNDQGGEQFSLSGRTQILGFTGRLDFNYLSSFIFAAAFTNNFSAQQNSTGYLQRHFDHDSLALNFVFSRTQVFEDFAKNSDQVILEKLPSVEVSSRLKQILEGKIPVWFSFEGSGGLLSRHEPTLQTSFPNDRLDLKPTVSSAFSFKGFSLYPSVSFEATDYSQQYSANSPTAATLATANLFRHDADFVLDFRLPSLERTYTPVKWLHLGNKIKHVIEVDAQYEYVTGINQFQRIIQFDQTDIISNTNQLTVGLTNRLYRKDQKGNVSEVLTWRLRQARYFDPTFGNSVIAGQRNVNLFTDELTPFTFLDGPRGYSPIVSSLTVNPYSFFAINYNADYDPRNHKFLDHSVDGSLRYKKYFVNLGETAIVTKTLLFPTTDQLIVGGGYGNSNRRGLNAGASVYYDIFNHRLTQSLYQVTYNSDCCGYSLQIRRINNFVRDDNEYLFSFTVANIGSVGTLQRQGRIF
jgi:LPS-assembly protein